MSELTLIIIRIGVLALLWLFIFIVLYSLRSDLFGPRLTPLQRVAVQSQRTREAASAAPAPAPADFERLRRLGEALLDELTGTVQAHARASGYSFAGAIDLGLEPDEGKSTGMLEIVSDTEAGEVVWTAVVDIKGKRHALRTGRTVIGRGSDADITLDDAGASRKHVEIVWDGTRAQVSDLGSTNGTTLNGRALSSALLEPDSIIDIGATRIVYRVLAQPKGRA